MFDSFSYNCLAFCLSNYCQHHPHGEIVVEESSAVTVRMCTRHSPAILWTPVTVVTGGASPIFAVPKAYLSLESCVHAETWLCSLTREDNKADKVDGECLKGHIKSKDNLVQLGSLAY